MVYDITNKDTFKHVKKWIEDLKEHAEPDIQIVLVGNKVDLCIEDTQKRVVTT